MTLLTFDSGMSTRARHAGLRVEKLTKPIGGEPAKAACWTEGISRAGAWSRPGPCEKLSAAGHFVIRYDHRDTGRSIAYEPGHPGYNAANLVADAARVLYAYEIPRAHVVGASAGGAFAQLLALEYRDRVRSLVLISTSAATAGDRHLPSPTDPVRRFMSTTSVDWLDRNSVVDYVVDFCRVLAGNPAPVRSGAHPRPRPQRRTRAQLRCAPQPRPANGRRVPERSAVIDHGTRAAIIGHTAGSRSAERQ